MLEEKKFDELEFLIVFELFYKKILKPIIVYPMLKKMRLVSFNLNIVLNKICKIHV